MRKQKAVKTAVPGEWQLDDFKSCALPPGQTLHIKGGTGGDNDGDGQGHEDIIDQGA